MKKKHRLFFVIVLFILIVIIIFMFLMLIPQKLIKSSDNIYSIEIQYAKYKGEIIKITDPTDINNLLEDLKPIKIKFGGFNIAYGGWAYRIWFYNSKGKLIQDCLINNPNEIEKYSITSWKIDTDKQIPYENIETLWEKYSLGIK